MGAREFSLDEVKYCIMYHILLYIIVYFIFVTMTPFQVMSLYQIAHQFPGSKPSNRRGDL